MSPASDSQLDEATTRSVLVRIARETDASPAVAERWFSELLRFLDLAAEMRATGDERALVPSPKVDTAWHALILHTRAYTELCQRRYGGYVHHEIAPPDESGSASEVFYYARTRVLMEKRYGGLDEDLWPLP
ncbi:MAG: hypothetical protein JOZ73_13475 [Solirubrobacterales bacterium]|nr:hypothetical protein [Solirubrobacterales bacterium]